MARETVVLVRDDIDGEVIDADGATIQFSLEGHAYEIDLSPANAEKLRSALTPFIGAGRSIGRTSGTTPAARAPRNRGGAAEREAIRVWARANGYTVGDRGRISDEIRNAYLSSK